MAKHVPLYPPGTVRALIESDLVTPPTRRALRARLRRGGGKPRFFDAHHFKVIRAACDRLVPQTGHDWPVDLGGELDARLADGKGDGWRYADMPPDADIHRQGPVGLDQSTQSMFGCGFAQALGAEREAVLRAVQAGKATGDVWATMDAARYFEELLALLVDIYYAHPLALEEIGYAGMADAHGWQAIGLGEHEVHEPLAAALARSAA